MSVVSGQFARGSCEPVILHAPTLIATTLAPVHPTTLFDLNALRRRPRQDHIAVSKKNTNERVVGFSYSVGHKTSLMMLVRLVVFREPQICRDRCIAVSLSHFILEAPTSQIGWRSIECKHQA
jgi:hypothetical protein